MSATARSDKPITDDHTTRVHPYANPNFLKSATHAYHGVIHVLHHERNARLHLLFALGAFLLGILLKVTDAELAAVFFAVIIVFLAEIFNTAIERTLDLIDPNENPRVKLIKDMAAGGVLLAAVAAVAIGLVVFGPALARLAWGH
jgi:diacylglycerol kinase